MYGYILQTLHTTVHNNYDDSICDLNKSMSSTQYGSSRSLLIYDSFSPQPFLPPSQHTHTHIDTTHIDRRTDRHSPHPDLHPE